MKNSMAKDKACIMKKLYLFNSKDIHKFLFIFVIQLFCTTQLFSLAPHARKKSHIQRKSLFRKYTHRNTVILQSSDQNDSHGQKNSSNQDKTSHLTTKQPQSYKTKKVFTSLYLFLVTSSFLLLFIAIVYFLYYFEIILINSQLFVLILCLLPLLLMLYSYIIHKKTDHGNTTLFFLFQLSILCLLLVTTLIICNYTKLLLINEDLLIVISLSTIFLLQLPFVIYQFVKKIQLSSQRKLFYQKRIPILFIFMLFFLLPLTFLILHLSGIFLILSNSLFITLFCLIAVFSIILMISIGVIVHQRKKIPISPPMNNSASQKTGFIQTKTSNTTTHLTTASELSTSSIVSDSQPIKKQTFIQNLKGFLRNDSKIKSITNFLIVTTFISILLISLIFLLQWTHIIVIRQGSVMFILFLITLIPFSLSHLFHVIKNFYCSKRDTNQSKTMITFHELFRISFILFLILFGLIAMDFFQIILLLNIPLLFIFSLSIGLTLTPITIYIIHNKIKKILNNHLCPHLQIGLISNLICFLFLVCLLSICLSYEIVILNHNLFIVLIVLIPFLALSAIILFSLFVVKRKTIITQASPSTKTTAHSKTTTHPKKNLPSRSLQKGTIGDIDSMSYSKKRSLLFDTHSTQNSS